MGKRYAVVSGARTRSEAEAYLPGNYEVVKQLDYEPQGLAFLIAGDDAMGWTLDGYVIPRYASGSMGCKEIGELGLAEVDLFVRDDGRLQHVGEAPAEVCGHCGAGLVEPGAVCDACGGRQEP